VKVTGTRQQRAWLRGELPPAELITPGVWSVPVPIPRNPLRYVLCYVIEHASGFLLVDPGWDDPSSWQALTDGLEACAVPLDAVTAVLITHVHPDHHGLSGAVREKSGAWIGMHEREGATLAAWSTPARHPALSAYLRWCGAPREHNRRLTTSEVSRNSGTGRMARADRYLAHGDLVAAPGLRLRVIWTPGHSPGHLCFHDETRGLLLTGDHVLPRITPNISAYDLESEPLDEYLRSLATLDEIEPTEVLPAHEYRFSGLGSRLAVLRDHHAERLDEVLEVLRANSTPQSAWQVATQVSWSRRWDDLSAVQHQAALGEVVAHLRHLSSQRLAACAVVDGVGHWRTFANIHLKE
jgi:glyoxylase-like metal-dependent hydrolase (beta-lactamase superfamily II)